MANASTLTRLPLLNGELSGGEAFVFSNPSDVLALLGIAMLVTDVFQIAETLQIGEIRAQFPVYRDQWIGVEEEVRARLRSKQLDEDGELDARDHLLLALLIVRDVWALEKPLSEDDTGGLQLIVSIADIGGEIEMDGDVPALFLRNGSIASLLTAAEPYVIRATAWVLSLVPGTPKSSGRIAGTLVEDIRTRARGELPVNQSSFLDLPRLDELEVGELNDRELVLILLHGFLGTDVGTFDEFLRQMNHATVGRRERLGIVGWPHDTLTSIDNNGHQLADLIHERIGIRGANIAFICHSRGGLVARAAALRLYEIGENYRRAVLGAITFGTPHEGTDLAAHSDGEFLSYFVCVLASRGSGRIATLREVADYRRNQRNAQIQGIQDLRPPDSPGFISDLKHRERTDNGKPDGSIRQLEIVSVGGDYPDSSSVGAILARQYFGAETHHDLVVPVSSSMPVGTSGRYSMPCSHGDYCSDKMGPTIGLGASVQHVLRWLT